MIKKIYGTSTWDTILLSPQSSIVLCVSSRKLHLWSLHSAASFSQFITLSTSITFFTFIQQNTTSATVVDFTLTSICFNTLESLSPNWSCSVSLSSFLAPSTSKHAFSSLYSNYCFWYYPKSSSIYQSKHLKNGSLVTICRKKMKKQWLKNNKKELENTKQAAWLITYFMIIKIIKMPERKTLRRNKKRKNKLISWTKTSWLLSMIWNRKRRRRMKC